MQGRAVQHSRQRLPLLKSKGGLDIVAKATARTLCFGVGSGGGRGVEDEWALMDIAMCRAW